MDNMSVVHPNSLINGSVQGSAPVAAVTTMFNMVNVGYYSVVTI